MLSIERGQDKHMMAFRTLCLGMMFAVAFISSAQGALGSAAAAAAAAHLRGSQRQLRALNAAVIAQEPKFYVQGRGELHFCSAQKSAGGLWAVGKDAALLAWMQATESHGWANVEEIDFCSGTESSNAVACWGGDGVYTRKAFVDLSCYTKPRCTTNADGSTACVGRR